jgi:hypothetical protein
MGQKQDRKDDGQLRLNRLHPPLTAPDGQQLKGVSRLVNPLADDAEIAGGDEDRVERHYLGRLLHVADEALQHVKRDGDHRKRRGRPQ